jgi:predicted DsbA family dithiol-disulfide isomerase
MKVEIWSDIMCPFCYIGKRLFEKGLRGFPHSDEVEIVWRSFQLDPSLEYEPGKTIHQVLADKKGLPVEQAKQLNEHVTQSAKQVGLHYNLDKAIPANTFHAHRFSHLAAIFHLQNEMEERLFEAYFSEGKNISDFDTLFALGVEIGLPEKEIRHTLQTNAYSDEVNKDVEAARELGIRGVPFFVIDGKYAVSGAQPAGLFQQALETAWKESRTKNRYADITETDTGTCSLNGNC